MKSAFLYLRVSTPQQADFGESLDLQEDIGRKYAQLHNFRVVGVFREPYTGLKNDRPILDQMLGRLETGAEKVDAVIIRYIERFSRGGYPLYNVLKQRVQALGAELLDTAGVIQPSRNALEEVGFEYEWSTESPSRTSEAFAAEAAYEERRKILIRTIQQQIRLVPRCVPGTGSRGTPIEGGHSLNPSRVGPRALLEKDLACEPLPYRDGKLCPLWALLIFAEEEREMRCLTTVLLGLLLIAPQLAAQHNQPVGIKRPQVVERWTQTLNKADTALKSGEWKKAYKTANAVLDEMCARIEGGEGVAELLGTATFLRALAEAGLGKEEAANWDFISAQVLVPELSKQNLARYGAAGKLLEPWRVSPDDSEGKTGIDLLDETQEQDVIAPKKIRAPLPKYPYGKYSSCLDGPIKVGFIINEQGLPTNPRLLTAQDPLLGFAAMEAVRDWRFKPAQLEGKPVPVNYRLTVNYKLERCQNLFATAKRAGNKG